MNIIYQTGVFFGYPECCIKWFIERMDKIRGGDRDAVEITPKQSEVSDGKGFIPCPTYSEKVKSAGELISNRICSRPYPDHPSDIEFENYIKSLL